MAATTVSNVFSTSILHVSSGASVASGSALSASTDVATALAGSGNLGRFPLVDLLLSITPTASMSSASNAVICYKRNRNALDVVSADEKSPGASYKPRGVGVFLFQGTTAAAPGAQVAVIENVDVSAGDCDFFIENQTNYNIPAGWTLTVRPKSYAAA